MTEPEDGPVDLDAWLPGPWGPRSDVPPSPDALGLRLEPGGLVLGRYRLEERIGGGGMGQVFRARDERLGRRIALKVLRRERLGDERSERLFDRESEILAGLSHPGIVTAHDRGADGDVSVLVMELVDGTDLATLRDQAASRLGEAGPRDTDGPHLARIVDAHDEVTTDSWFRTVARWTVSILEALQAAHDAGVVHRDIKPANVMLRPDGRPALLDFGLGGHVGSTGGTVTEGLCGTLAYIAPEQVRAQRTLADPRTDVYQVGLVLYELCTLRPAFGGESAPTLVAIDRGDFPRPRTANPAVPRLLESICLQALERDPGRRYPSARAFAEDLERWVTGRSVRARGTTPVGRLLRDARQLVRRRPFASAAAASVGAILVTAIVAMKVSPVVDHALQASAWMLPPGGSAPRVLSPGGPIRSGDMLGVLVETADGGIVHALSISGGASPEGQYVRPVRPRSLTALTVADETRGGGRSAEVGEWGLRVPAGRTHVALVRAAAETEGEGLLVFVTPDRPWAVETWFQRIAQVEEEQYSGVFPGVPRREADPLYPRPGDDARRGEPLAELSVVELERHLRELDAELVLEGADWDDRLGVRYEAWFPVLGGEASRR